MKKLFSMVIVVSFIFGFVCPQSYVQSAETNCDQAHENYDSVEWQCEKYRNSNNPQDKDNYVACKKTLRNLRKTVEMDCSAPSKEPWNNGNTIAIIFGIISTISLIFAGLNYLHPNGQVAAAVNHHGGLINGYFNRVADRLDQIWNAIPQRNLPLGIAEGS